jgi:ABC-2 type transport system ATP-binding protein
MVHVSLRNAAVEIPVYGVGSNSLKMTLMRRAVGGRVAQSGSHVMVKALAGVSIDAKDGDRIGIIGQNGAGKTTLLRVLAGVYPPTSGEVELVGRVSPMFDISLGMAADATGIENIRMCGTLWGLTRAEIDAGMDDVAAFTELGDYLNIPVRTYSTGMMLRLAFGIATLRRPEILLLDEIIGVGDATFFTKARDRLQTIATEARIIFLSSHSMEVIRDLCNKVLWLYQGKVVGFGPVEEVIATYLATSTRQGGAALVADDPVAA